MSDEPAREMTLDEYVGALPFSHRAVKELAELRLALSSPAAPATPSAEQMVALEAIRDELRNVQAAMQLHGAVIVGDGWIAKILSLCLDLSSAAPATDAPPMPCDHCLRPLRPRVSKGDILCGCDNNYVIGRSTDAHPDTAHEAIVALEWLDTLVIAGLGTVEFGITEHSNVGMWVYRHGREAHCDQSGDSPREILLRHMRAARSGTAPESDTKTVGSGHAPSVEGQK